MIPLLYAIFVLSGVAGLIYETIWTRYLGLFVGHSAYAQVIVLVIFLGGMSVGALVVGRVSERITRPLAAYGIVELATGALGIAFHDVFVFVTNVAYDRTFPALGVGPMQTAVKWSIAGALILPQSVLLGATFPLMSAAVVRRIPARAGRAISTLYFANSLGGAVGVLLTGFVLVAMGGLPGTLLVAAMLNIVVAGVAFMASSRADGAPAELQSAPVQAEPALHTLARPWLWRLLLAVSFGTALSSFIYEIAWVRMLALVLGSATHSFELMLSAFILGLALGAFWIRRRADADARPLRRLGLVQLAMGSLAIATLPVYLASFHWMAGMLAAFAKSDAGYNAFSVSRYAICLSVMLPATFCAGMTLPLITRALLGAGIGERAIGQVYGINTLGAIVGASIAGLVLLPLLGLKWLLIAGASVDLALGVALLAADAWHGAAEAAAGPGSHRRRVWRIGGAAALAAGLAVLILGSPFRRTVLTSGVYRYGSVDREADTDVVFYKDGRTATVSVRRVEDEGHAGLALATNGKPDASLGSDWIAQRAAPAGPFAFDASTQTLIPLIALAYAPGAREVAVIGHGSGVTSHTLLASPAVKHLVTIEIEPEMVRGARMFYPGNRRAFDDRRASVAIDDARSYFAASHQRFDLIVSEPSNPWVSGVAGLFTTEFYARVRAQLSPGGVFAQWLHLYEIDDGLVASVVAALAANFPAFSVFQTSDEDVLIVAASGDRLPVPNWSIAKLPALATDLRLVWPITPDAFEALRVADGGALAPLVRSVPPNSDYYPTLDLNAERDRYTGADAAGFSHLTADRVNLPALVSRRRLGAGEVYDVVPDLAHLHAAAMTTALRGHKVTLGLEAAKLDQQHRMFMDELTLGRPPADWRAWVPMFSDVEATVHGGMAGVADSAFYNAVERYLARAAAPAEPRAVVHFMHGIAAWDFGEASRAADVLIAPATDGNEWLGPDLLRDGAVVSKLELGDRAGARAAFEALLRASQRDPGDLRTRLLYAYLTDTTGALFPRR